MFCDINDFWNPALDVNEWWTIGDFNRAIVRGGSVLMTGATCGLHLSSSCVLRAASCAVGGTPCPD
eukprot:3075033-Pyramimonas_sp.AAC.1